MQFPMLQKNFQKVNTFNEHFYLRVRLEQKEGS